MSANHRPAGAFEVKPAQSIAVLAVGIALGAALLAWCQSGAETGSLLHRYTSHPIEKVCVLLFACAVAVLAAKAAVALVNLFVPADAIIPEWDGKPQPAESAVGLFDRLQDLAAPMRNSILANRVREVLDFVIKRRSANDLDDHLRDIADRDDLSLESSYGLIRFITWAIPILGFLGTVLGITGAIAGVTPEVLEQSLSRVTDGLALAFDTTAVALALTMVVMFCGFVTEKLERCVLRSVDSICEERLAHRFQREGKSSGGVEAALRRQTEMLLEAIERVVLQQARLWNQTVQEAQSHWRDEGERQQERLAASLAQALDRTEQRHQENLDRWERTTESLGTTIGERLEGVASTFATHAAANLDGLRHLAERVERQSELLLALAEKSSEIARLQETLQLNLSTLAETGAFEQAVASFTAAIHLLTSKVNAQHTERPPRKAA